MRITSSTLVAWGAAALLGVAGMGCGGEQIIEPPSGMVHVTKGSFRSGYQAPDATPAEKANAQSVEVEAFFIDINEVTNGDYLRFVKANKIAPPTHWKGKLKDGELPADMVNLPVVNVTYADAEGYAKFQDKRLPTEQEWEYAARGPKSLTFPWGPEWQDGAANIFDEGHGGPVPVGQYTAGKGPFGTLDQAGNVWEWTSTVVPGTDKHYVKGGSFSALETKPRPSVRGIAEKSERRPNLGFRCAKSIE